MRKNGFTFIELLITITLISIFTTGGFYVFSKDSQGVELDGVVKVLKNDIALALLPLREGGFSRTEVLFQASTPNLFLIKNFPKENALISSSLPHNLRISSLTEPSVVTSGSISFQWDVPTASTGSMLTFSVENTSGGVRTESGASTSFSGVTLSDLSWAEKTTYRVCISGSEKRCSNSIVLTFFDLENLSQGKEHIQLDKLEAERSGKSVNPSPQVVILQLNASGGKRVFADGEEVTKISLQLKKNEKNTNFLSFP